MARKPHVEGQLGLFRPESDWVRPSELPDLRGRPLVALDTETRDDGLAHGKGAGWALGPLHRPLGRLCGVSWAADGSSGYAPVAHPDTDCFPLESVLRWADDLFRSGTRVVFMNAPYDVGWLGSYGVAPPPAMEDVLPACVMIDEGRGGGQYNLDALCAWQGIPGKDKRLLEDAVQSYGGNPRKASASIHLLPARYAAPYAEQDAVATLGLWRQVEGQLRAQELWEAYRTEVELIPMVVAMRRRGVRIDVDRAVRTAAHFRAQRDAALREITEGLGMRRACTIDDIRSPSWMEGMFDAQKIPYKRTAKMKQGSFTKDWMEGHEHFLPRCAVVAEKFEEGATKFIETFLLGFSVRGRLHAEVNQFLSDEGGTRSHRFSYADPPLQQMPSPDKDAKDRTTGEILADRALGTPIRECFLPEKGEYWAAPDFSSQEPRLTVHFASVCRCEGVQSVVDEYNRNPRTDYHAVVAKMVNRPRPIAKILNLGMTYGKGKRSLAEELGVSLEEAEGILTDYHARLPYIKSLESLCKRRASERGYIRLIDGARMHYNEWEGGWIDYEVRLEAEAAGHKLNPCSREEAVRRQSNPDHPWSRTRLRRADTRKTLNNLVQGSAARQTKIAMRNMWREGIVPLLQMHDEVCVSVGSKEQVDRVSQLMIEAVRLVVPVVVDAECGPSWGRAKLLWDDCVAKYGPPDRLAA